MGKSDQKFYHVVKRDAHKEYPVIEDRFGPGMANIRWDETKTLSEALGRQGLDTVKPYTDWNTVVSEKHLQAQLTSAETYIEARKAGCKEDELDRVIEQNIQEMCDNWGKVCIIPEKDTGKAVREVRD